MFKRVLNVSQRIAIYGLIGLLWLPLSLVLGNVKSAQAASAKSSVVQKTTKPIPAEKPKASKMAFIGLPTGLHRGNTYVAGQSISLRVSLSGEPISVWAEAGTLDSRFPAKIYLKNEGQGNWFLQTPKLSDNLNLGSNFLKIIAQNGAGEIVQTQVKITLQKFPAVTISSYRVFSTGTAKIVWQPVSWADAYLVNWQIQDDQTSRKFERTKLTQITIENLVPGTFYEVGIQPLRGDAVGPEAKAVFKTLGLAPVKIVAGEISSAVSSEARKEIPREIGEGVATSRKVVQAKPPTITATPKQEEKKPEVTTTPSPSPSEAPKTQTGGWSKLLVALSILIIAAAAAIGGYYGYEWLIARAKDKDEPPSSDSSSRW